MIKIISRTLVVFTVLYLSACSSQQTSPKAVYQPAQAYLDSKTRTQISDSIKSSVPFFDQFYQVGKKTDRVNGMMRHQRPAREIPLPSRERHALQAVNQLALVHFEPNRRMRIQESMLLSIPFFDKFYQMGETDRANGITYEQAQQKDAYFRSSEFLSEVGQKGVFSRSEYSADNLQKQRQILLDAAVATYWDGYEGRP